MKVVFYSLTLLASCSLAQLLGQIAQPQPLHIRGTIMPKSWSIYFTSAQMSTGALLMVTPQLALLRTKVVSKRWQCCCKRREWILTSTRGCEWQGTTSSCSSSKTEDSRTGPRKLVASSPILSVRQHQHLNLRLRSLNRLGSDLLICRYLQFSCWDIQRYDNCYQLLIFSTFFWYTKTSCKDYSIKSPNLFDPGFDLVYSHLLLYVNYTSFESSATCLLLQDDVELTRRQQHPGSSLATPGKVQTCINIQIIPMKEADLQLCKYTIGYRVKLYPC